MIHNAARSRQARGHRLLLCATAGTLLYMAFVMTGCQTTQPMANDQTNTTAAPESANRSVKTLTSQSLEPQQRIEAVIVEPAGKIKKRRVRGVIAGDHRLMIPPLGTFDTQNKTLAQLEQEVLASFNQGSALRGTVRLNLVTLETTGLFVTASPEVLEQLQKDTHQLKLLDAGNHPLWQWVTLDDTIQTSIRNHSGTPALASIMHDDKHVVLARTAHPVLTGQSLYDHVIQTHVTLNPVNQHRNLTVQLSPAAGTALKTLGQTHLEQQLLIVRDGVCVYTATITPYMGEILVITSGQKSFDDQQIAQLKSVFENEE